MDEKHQEVFDFLARRARDWEYVFAKNWVKARRAEFEAREEAKAQGK